MKTLICAASDCNHKFKPKSYQQKYCSDQCRWRDSKRKTYKERAKSGACLQCGGVMDVTISVHKSKVTTSYCAECQDYFRENYLKNKNEKE